MEQQQQSGSSATVRINGINWSLDPIGFLVADLLFEETEIFGRKLNSFPLGLTDNFKKYQLDIGSTVTFSLVEKDEDGHAKLEITNYELSYTKPVMPDKCLSCSSELAHNYKQVGGDRIYGLQCSNWFCEWKVTTPLYRFLELAITDSLVSTAFDEAVNWMSSFPDNKGNKLGADSMVSFIPLFKQLGSKNTAMRNKILTDCYGDKLGQKLFDLERGIENLFMDGLSISQFWYISSIPHVSLDVCNEDLSNIHPNEWISTPKEPIFYRVVDSIDRYKSRWSLFAKILPFKQGTENA